MQACIHQNSLIVRGMYDANARYLKTAFIQGIYHEGVGVWSESVHKHNHITAQLWDSAARKSLV